MDIKTKPAFHAAKVVPDRVLYYALASAIKRGGFTDTCRIVDVSYWLHAQFEPSTFEPATKHDNESL